MKKVILLFAILFAAGLNSSRAQDTWTQKADFGGAARDWATGFSIDGSGYIGTGVSNDGINYHFYKDFWEYNILIGVWTQKADFVGGVRYGAVGFNVEGKGYIGCGSNGTISVADFWQFDPANNSWIQKSDFAGGARVGAIGFSIVDRGYIGTGSNASNYYNDFWEYSPTSDTWTQKANCGGVKRERAVGFSIGTKGYVGGGWKSVFGEYLVDFMEYDPATDTWIQKSDFPGPGREGAVGITIGSSGYVGLGTQDGIAYYNDWWKFNPITNTWNQEADFTGTVRHLAVGLSIGNKGYVGTGESGAINNQFNDFWEYTPDDIECEVPTNLSSTIIIPTKVYLKWDAVTGAEKYKLRYRVTGTSTWTIINPVAHSKIIMGLSPNTEYEWQVKTICHAAAPKITSDWCDKQYFTTDPLRLGSVANNLLIEVYPNPFSNSAIISFFLTDDAFTTIELYDLSGKKLQTILDENLASGNHEIKFNRGQLVAGVYLLEVKMGEEVEVEKLVVE